MQTTNDYPQAIIQILERDEFHSLPVGSLVFQHGRSWRVIGHCNEFAKLERPCGEDAQ